MSNTTASGVRYATTTGFSSGSPAIDDYRSRLGSSMSSGRSRDSVVLKGRFVVSSKGQAEVLVSVDQKTFNRAMAVRDVNNHVVRKTSFPLETAVSISTD